MYYVDQSKLDFKLLAALDVQFQQEENIVSRVL